MADLRPGLRPPLPCPQASPPVDWMARLEALTWQHQRRRAQAEGAGTDWGTGRGDDFVGYRPYRAGEDARSLDFSLLARSGRPFVKMTRREAHQSVQIVLDTSASMAVGTPGKWQSAVEIVLAYANLWSRQGAEVRLLHGGTQAALPVLRGPQDWRALADTAFALRAQGRGGLREALARQPAGADQVLMVGDLWDLEPKDVQPYLRARTQWTVLRVLAPEEIDPSDRAPVLWLDPESDAEPIAVVEEAQRQRYRERLAAWDEAWRRGCAAQRMRYLTHVAGRPFEQALRALSPGGAL